MLEKIKEAQKIDKEIEEIKEKIGKGKAKGFHEDEQGTLWHGKRICVPQDLELRKLILQEAHTRVETEPAEPEDEYAQGSSHEVDVYKRQISKSTLL